MDTAQTIVGLLSHLCDQGRCFVVDGADLPLCQRCTGLYLGAAVTFVWLIAARAWRWGLPARSVFFVQVAFIILAGLGGLHVIDIGPQWRLACGLWTGHIVAAWLFAGTAVLWHVAWASRPRLAVARASRPRVSRASCPRTDTPALPRAPRIHNVIGMLMLPAIGAMALTWPLLAGLGWWPLTIAALAGMVCLLTWTALAASGLVLRSVSRLRW